MPQAGSTERTAPVVAGDVVRQAVLALAAVIAATGWFAGAAGWGRVPRAADRAGVFAADGMLLQPASGAFLIWSVVEVGFLLLAVWQFFPNERTRPRQRRSGWWIAGAMLLHAAWVLAVHADLVWLALVLIAAQTACLLVAYRVLQQTEAAGPVDVLLADGTIGLFLGWTFLAVVANVDAALLRWGFDGFGIPGEVWAIAAIALVAAAGAGLAAWDGGRFAPAIALVWGLVWIGVVRVDGQPHSFPTAVAALLAAVVIGITTVLARLRDVAVDDD